MQGYCKKILLADNLSGATIAVLYAPTSYEPISVLAAIIGFAARLYCDFSGYTDIARGLAKLLGLELPENFFAPYFSSTFRAFWRNWHRTLTAWLRDYVYIPLGGNRVSYVRRSVNTLVVLLSIGVWHGAGYNYILLGLGSGLWLIIEERWLSVLGTRNFPGLPAIFLRVTGVVITFTVTVLFMVTLATPDLATTFAVYSKLSELFASPASDVVFLRPPIDLMFGGFAAALFFHGIQVVRDRYFAETGSAKFRDWLEASGHRWRRVSMLLALWLLGFLFLVLMGSYLPGGQDFIYFQF